MGIATVNEGVYADFSGIFSSIKTHIQNTNDARATHKTTPLNPYKYKQKSLQTMMFTGFHFGRGEWIRTTGLYVPNVALYQTKLHLDSKYAQCDFKSHCPVFIHQKCKRCN